MPCKNTGFNNLDDSREGIEKYMNGGQKSITYRNSGLIRMPGIHFRQRKNKKGQTYGWHIAAVETPPHKGSAADRSPHAKSTASKRLPLKITALMKIKLLKRYAADRFTFEVLKSEYGIYAVRGPRGIPDSLSETLEK